MGKFVMKILVNIFRTLPTLKNSRFGMTPIDGIRGKPKGHSLIFRYAIISRQFFPCAIRYTFINLAINNGVYALQGSGINIILSPIFSIAHERQQSLNSFLRVGSIVFTLRNILHESLYKIVYGKSVS